MGAAGAEWLSRLPHGRSATARLAARVALAAFTALAVLVPSASAIRRRVVIFNLTPTPLVKPDRVFFQADAGPYLTMLKWSGWGTRRATGRGRWILDCSHGGPSCAPGAPSLDYPARYVLSQLVPCPRFGAAGRSYRAGIVYIYEPGHTVTKRFPSDYDWCAKPPTLAEAKSAVARYAVRKLGAQQPSVSCKRAGQTDVSCTARWMRNRQTARKNFDVFALLTPRPHIVVRPLR